MRKLKLAHEIIQELDLQLKEEPDTIVTGERLAAHAGLVYFGGLPFEPGTPSGRPLPVVRRMAIALAALTMRYILEGDWGE